MGDENIEDVTIYAIDERASDLVLTLAEIEGYVDNATSTLNAEGDASALTSVGEALVRLGGLVKLGEFLLRLKGAA